MLDSYNKGFMTKCAEYDIPFDTAFKMLKVAQAMNDNMEKKAWSYGSSALAGGALLGYPGAAAGAALYGGGKRTSSIASTSDAYTRAQLAQRNANLLPYLDKVDSGQAGNALGRAWHGMMDNWLGRRFGIRGSRDYIRDKEVERLRGAGDLARKDVDAQKAYNEAINGGPQLDQLQVSSVAGYDPRKSNDPSAIAGMNTGFRQPGTPSLPVGEPNSPERKAWLQAQNDRIRQEDSARQNELDSMKWDMARDLYNNSPVGGGSAARELMRQMAASRNKLRQPATPAAAPAQPAPAKPAPGRPTLQGNV